EKGSFRRLLETKAGTDFKDAVLALEQSINEQAATFSSAPEITKVLDSVMQPLEAAMDTLPAPVSDVIRFLPEGGSISGLLRSLGVAIDLQDGNGPLPLFRHAATLTTALATAQALSTVDKAGVIAIDDFGEDLDTGLTQHLAAILRRNAGQLWLTT